MSRRRTRSFVINKTSGIRRQCLNQLRWTDGRASMLLVKLLAIRYGKVIDPVAVGYCK